MAGLTEQPTGYTAPSGMHRYIISVLWEAGEFLYARLQTGRIMVW